MKSRSTFTVLSLAFLDVMSCGFGAVVLFFVIITAATDQEPANRMDSAGQTGDLRAERMRAERDLARVQVELREAKEELAKGAAETERLVSAVEEESKRLALLDADTIAQEKRVEQLEADIRSREEDRERLSAKGATPDPIGDSLTKVAGDGRRQYLTGLRMGGDRVLILVDKSASMLDDTIVNVIRRRNLDRARKLAAPKWKRAVSTVNWLVSQIDPNSRFQIFAFNTEAQPVLQDGNGEWLDASRAGDLKRAVTALAETEPSGGTSFHTAFDVIAKLNPPPDNVYLLVDGLPTQGRSAPRAATIDGAGRLDHFRAAVASIEEMPPMNVILFPMEGDPLAAAAFWELAQVSGGSFMAPSRDWP